MDPKEKDILEKTYQLEKENNRILKGIRNTNRWTIFFKIIYWTLIILVAVGAFYFVQPYVDSFLNTYQNLTGDLGGIKSMLNKVTNKTN